MDQISSTFHQGPEKRKMSPEIHHKIELFTQNKFSHVRSTWSGKKCSNQHGNHIIGRQGFHKNTIIDNFETNYNNRQPDGASEINRRGYQSTEGRIIYMEKNSPRIVGNCK